MSTQLLIDLQQEVMRIAILKESVLAIINAPVDCPTAHQVKQLRGAAAFIGWDTKAQPKLTGSLHPMHDALTRVG